MIKMNLRFFYYCLCTFLVSLYFIFPSLNADELKSFDTHLKLRNDTAINYFSPESHLRLAKYHYDLGNKVQAFYISEYVRQIFGDDDFTPAFYKVAAIKLNEIRSFKNDEDYNEYCKTHPDSIEAYLKDLYKRIEDSKSKQSIVDQLVESALAKYPKELVIKAMAAKYYLKEREDFEKALTLYIDLYFCDPHFYDWEYAEFRIKGITSSQKASWYETRQKSGASLIKIAAEEKNPRVLDIIISTAREKWDPSMASAMLAMLDNDDPSVQTGALHTLLSHPEDLCKSADIHKLLKSDDFVKRAMAPFIFMKCQNDDSDYSLLKDNLDSGIELIQLDTIQALSMMGGEKGLEYLKVHSPAKASKKILEIWKHQTSQGNK